MFSAAEQALMELKVLNGQVTSKIINDLIREHKPLAKEMKRLYEAYKAETLSIKERVFQDETKINNKLNNDYRGEIIDEVIGYMFGKPITYQLDELAYENKERKYEVALTELSNFLIKNAVDDLDAETGKMAAICGYAARLCYIDKEGNERVMNVDPWECIFVNDGSLDETQFSLRYYPIKKDGKELIKVEWYDNEKVTFYIQDGNEFVLDDTEAQNPMLHMFDYNPLIKFVNNKEEQGDFVKVESLIDAYDRTLSDAQNEIEEFRNAYMVFKNCEIDKETILEARKTGAFSLPDKDTDAQFLVKNIISEFYENHKKTLNDNIYKFSKSVDMTDEKFSGSAMTGEARKWKLIALENKAATKERKFSKALRQMFKVLCSAWKKKSIDIDYLNIYWNFTRNIPIELRYEAEVLEKLFGKISRETLYSLMSFIDDPRWEVDKVNEEYEPDLDNVNFDENLNQNIEGNE